MTDEVDKAFSITEELTQTGIDAVRFKANPVREPVYICEECTNPIPAERRKIIPGIHLCVYCQTRKEKLEKHFI